MTTGEGAEAFYILAPGFISNVRPAIAPRMLLYAGGKRLSQIDVSPSEFDDLLDAYGIPAEMKTAVTPGTTWSWARTTLHLARQLREEKSSGWTTGGL
ncbi:hypothetical protein AB1K56_04930 [Microbacterium sp. BWR-S6Y]|uniref:hypothetical protein n=1 Tax=Microbacterium sp. BWR-S6Y TaxID=3232073 RepID=UPI0035272F00